MHGALEELIDLRTRVAIVAIVDHVVAKAPLHSKSIDGSTVSQAKDAGRLVGVEELLLGWMAGAGSSSLLLHTKFYGFTGRFPQLAPAGLKRR